MKFFKLLILTILGLFHVPSLISSKSAKGRKHPSGATRNYRKVAPDPSLNPLPASYQTGPLNNYGGGHNHAKYKAYNFKLADYHNYHDTTTQLKHRVVQ